MRGPARVVVVGDARIARVLGAGLGVAVFAVENAELALLAIEAQAADVVLIDADRLGDSADQLLSTAHERWPDLLLVVVKNQANGDARVRALAAGASDLVSTDSEEDLEFALQKALVQVERARAPAPPEAARHLVLGRSPVMRGVAEMLARIAPTAASVLVRGESGTGKELVARALHRASPRAAQPFIKIDCASLPDTLLESELFGYEKGAFTGASARKPGRVELAQSGTLFLDEIGELSLTTQAKLLRLLQDREFERLGGTKTISVEVRVLAATHRDLETMVERGQFRQDLFYRLNVVPLWLPPLRARRGDIEELALHFIREAAARNQRDLPRLTRAAVELLARQRWPGNVRQLQNFMERLVILAPAPVLDEASIQAELERPSTFDTEVSTSGATRENSPSLESETEPSGAEPLDHLSQVVRDAERQALLRALAQVGGNRSVAARLLGVSRSTFYAKLRDHGLL